MSQLEYGAVDLFSNTVKEDGLLIDMEVPVKPRTLDVYIQGWHNQIWEHGFVGFFKGKDSYSKSKAFQDQRHFKTRGKPTLPLSELSSGKDSIPKWQKIVPPNS
jgi:hypothetical protein